MNWGGRPEEGGSLGGARDIGPVWRLELWPDELENVQHRVKRCRGGNESSGALMRLMEVEKAKCTDSRSSPTGKLTY